MVQHSKLPSGDFPSQGVEDKYENTLYELRAAIPIQNKTDNYFVKAELNEDEGVYYVVDHVTDKADATHFVPVKTADSKGKIILKGLEDDTYTMTEVRTDSGYVMLKQSIDVVISKTETTGLCDIYESDVLGLIQNDPRYAEIIKDTGDLKNMPQKHLEHKLMTASATVGGKKVNMVEDNGSVNAEAPLTVVNTRGFDLPKTGDHGTWMYSIGGVLLMAVAAVYLGASSQNMALGAAQLGQTSIPVGGKNTNAVIAGHRGWNGADYFRYITELVPGDHITITNLWETLEYAVVGTRIISPDDVDAIKIQPGKDMILRLNPQKGDYNLYCYCYRKDWFDRHLNNAEKGIRFIDPNYKELFRIEDGDRIRYFTNSGEPRHLICRYIDDYHFEATSDRGKNLYHICEFAEQYQNQGCHGIIPLRQSLPESCFSTLGATGELIVITKGEKGYSPTDVYPQNTSPKEGAAALNAANGVTKAQEAAMVAGSMFGWETPAANPKNYDALGQPIKNQRRSHATER